MPVETFKYMISEKRNKVMPCSKTTKMGTKRKKTKSSWKRKKRKKTKTSSFFFFLFFFGGHLRIFYSLLSAGYRVPVKKILIDYNILYTASESV